MTVENCQHCGGTHFGSYECPYGPVVEVQYPGANAAPDASHPTMEALKTRMTPAVRAAWEALRGGQPRV